MTRYKPCSVGRVALITMPWSSVSFGSLGLGILKECLKRQDVPVDVLYLNLRLAKTMDLRLYEVISATLLIGELLFAQHLFGKLGTGEIDNSFSQVWRDEAVRTRFTEMFEEHPDVVFDLERVSDEIIPAFLESCLKEVPWPRYEIIGFSTTFFQNSASLLLAKKLKEQFPEKTIVFGGANAQGEMGVALLETFPWVDYVVHGEAEQSLPALVKNILTGNRFERVPGVSFRQGSNVIVSAEFPSLMSLDDIPAPDYSDYFDQLRDSGLNARVTPRIYFETSRGCWWGEKSHCVFCGLNPQSMKFRSKSPTRALHEISSLASRYKVLDFCASDSVLDPNYLREFFPSLITQGLDLSLFYELKPNLRKEDVALLKEAGVRIMQPGIESFDTQLLKLMKKGVTAIQNIQFLKWCREFGVTVLWCFLYGLPGEQGRQYEQMLKTLPLFTHLHPPVKVSKLRLQRFSPYQCEGWKYGITEYRPDPMYSYLYPQSKVDLKIICYFFDYPGEVMEENPEIYIAPIKEFVSRWKQLFYSNTRPLFSYCAGSGFIRIYDSRPLSPDCEMTHLRQGTLAGLAADVYRFCDANRSFAEIRSFVESNQQPGSFGESEIQTMLDYFVAEKLMYREGDRYLGLAVRMNPQLISLSPLPISELAPLPVLLRRKQQMPTISEESGRETASIEPST